MRSLLAVGATALLLTGCGAQAEETPATQESSSPSSRAAAAEPTESSESIGVMTADDLLGCLTAAGLDARTADTVPYGVEVPVTSVKVAGLESYSGEPEQGASLYVFDDAAAAAENAALITLGLSDDPENDMYGVHDNVVRAMWMVLRPAPHTDDEQAVLDCMPASDESAPEATEWAAPAGDVTGEQLLACVSEAGLTATLAGEDESDVGIYDALSRVDVTGMPGDVPSSQTWVFPDEATRTARTGDIWWGSLPHPKILERANTLTWLEESPADGDPGVAALAACLPAG